MASLPGVGKRTALRYILDIIGRSDEDVERFIKSLAELKANIRTCSQCHNLSDRELCDICTNPSRDKSTVCVVEDIRDVMAIEATHQYKGLYHVLGGKISPMDGIGPGDLEVGSLLERMNKGEFTEVILALSSTMEGDTTAYFIFKKLDKFDNLVTTTLSRGVPIGDELQYTDEVTLGRSIIQRTPYDQSLQ